LDKERALGLEEEEKQTVIGILKRPTNTERDIFNLVKDAVFKEKNVFLGWRRRIKRHFVAGL